MKLRSIAHILLFALLLIGNTSCVKHIFLLKQDQPYLQGETNGGFPKYEYQEYRIQSQDLITVNLNSPDLTTNAYFNRESAGMRVNQPNIQSIYLNGYLVSNEGVVNLPLVGDVKVGGQTTLEIESIIEGKLKEKHPELSFDIVVKLGNFRVTVLGEVMRPGTYYFYESKNTILQAISLAGDFDEYANRKKIRIVREFPDKTETYIVDVSSMDFLSSQQFILRTGDVIYVEPIRSKVFSTNTRNTSVLLSAVSVFFSAITTAITLYRLSQ